MIFRGSTAWPAGTLPLLAAVFLLLPGCRREEPSSTGSTPPNSGAPASYGPPSGKSSLDVPRKIPAAANAGWASAPFYILQTQLSPATLVHSASRQLRLFSGMTNDGLSAPTYVAWATRNGPRTFKRGENLEATNMVENWVLVWWANAPGWKDWDCPWVVFLQHRPNAMRLDEDGLQLNFPTAAGDVVMMPLYGYEKPPQQGRDFRAAHGLAAPKVPIKPWEWPKVIPRDPLTRIRYWAAATREFPIHSAETFSVSRSADSVTIRSRLEWRPIADDWKTRRIKLAPVSPPLAHAAKLGGFPVRFSARWFDLEMPTPFGPWLAIEDADAFDVTVSVLQYVNETERFEPPAANAHPALEAALKRLRTMISLETDQPPRVPGARDHLANYLSNLAWRAKATPFLDDAARSNLTSELRRQLHEVLLPLLKNPQTGNRAPGNDDDTVRAAMLETLWACAHFTGDWNWLKEHWPDVKAWFTTPSRMNWVQSGRGRISAIGDEAAHCAAFARLAYRAGDMDAYHYACLAFARQITLLFVKQRGADYFRQHQPWHSTERIDAEVMLASMGDTGWQLEGPNHPAKGNARQLARRWLRFEDFDVARFYRDHALEDVRRELNWWQRRWSDRPAGTEQADPLPSTVQLRSMLLNESPATTVSTNSFPEEFLSSVSDCVSILRTSRPTRFERLIPAGEPGPFVTGLEREVADFGPTPLVAVDYNASPDRHGTNSLSWPKLTWPAWRTPAGAHWSFGQIRTGSAAQPRAARVLSLNWNTRVTIFEE